MNHQQALDAFLSRKAEIDALLAKFQAASDEHFDIAPEAVDWGHVGSLGYALERLADAASFLETDMA